jgi:PBP1b-binding outer membrane lipoprotein LpoB
MRIASVVAVVALAATLSLAPGCAHKQVTRIPTDAVTDLSGNWNDTDSRLVSDEMIADCLGRAWITDHIERTGKKPSVIVGTIQNKTTEHIAVGTFVGDIERALINSDKVLMVASPEERQQVREERADQQTYSSEETMKRWGREKGADYMMGGVINTILDHDRGKTAKYYQVDLSLIHLESNAKVWIGQKKIKKFVEQKKFGL